MDRCLIEYSAPVMEDGFLGSLTKLVTDIKRPDGLLLYLGLVLFVVGVINGPFDISNPKLSWGITCLLGSLAWFYLSQSVGWIHDGYNAHRPIEWSNVVLGLAVLLATAIFFYRQFTGIWLIPSSVKKHF